MDCISLRTQIFYKINLSRNPLLSNTATLIVISFLPGILIGNLTIDWYSSTSIMNSDTDKFLSDNQYHIKQELKIIVIKKRWCNIFQYEIFIFTNIEWHGGQMILMYRENFSAVVVILHDPVVFLKLHLRKGFF